MPKVHCKTFRFTVALVLPLLAVTFGLVSAIPAHAQGLPIPPPPPPPETSSTGPTSNTDSPPTPSKSDQAEDQSTATFKVGVDVVQLFFNVKDKRGALIPH